MMVARVPSQNFQFVFSTIEKSELIEKCLLLQQREKPKMLAMIFIFNFLVLLLPGEDFDLLILQNLVILGLQYFGAFNFVRNVI